jgi:predicted dehydrogenase
MIEAAENNERRLLVLQGTWRYWPMTLKVKELVENGEIGQIVSAYLWTRAPLPQETPGAKDGGWFLRRSTAAGGAFIDHGIYQLDLIEWLSNSKFDRFDSYRLLNVRYNHFDLEDYGCGVARFSNGLHAVLEEYWCGHVFSSGFELRGTLGEVRADTAASPAIWLYTAKSGERTYISPPERNSVTGAMDMYFDYLAGTSNESPPQGEDGKRILDAFLQLQQEKVR